MRPVQSIELPKAQNLIDVLHVIDLIPSEQGHGTMGLEVEGAEIQQHGSLPCLAAKHCEALKLFVSRHLQDTAEAKFCEAKAAATLALLSLKMSWVKCWRRWWHARAPGASAPRASDHMWHRASLVTL